MAIVAYRGTREDLMRLIRVALVSISGRGPDPLNMAGPVLTRGAVVLLSKIQGAFIQKARGGIGEDGIVWKALAASTIARRRSSRRERKELGIGEGYGTGTMADAERRQFHRLRRQYLAGLRARGIDRAEIKAAAAAWAQLRRSGARTKHVVLAGRDVEILRDTDDLLNSLTPGYEELPAHPPGQILETKPGQIVVGTNEKPWHHLGGPKLPARNYWPPDGNLPQSWFDAIGAAILRGILAGISRAIASGARV